VNCTWRRDVLTWRRQAAPGHWRSRPILPEAHNTLGIALLKMARLDEALASFRAAVNLKPEFVEAHLNLAAALRSIGHLDAAAAGYRRALEWNIESASAHVGLATVVATAEARRAVRKQLSPRTRN